MSFSGFSLKIIFQGVGGNKLCMIHMLVEWEKNPVFIS
jgi:hypothetical protein